MKRRPPADLEAIGLFVRIVDHGSLSAAGRALGIPKATLSRRLAQLERSLGTALLRRTTRAHSLTAAGRSLYDRVAPFLVEAERAAGDIQAAAEEPAGLVRVSAAVGFGQLVLMPILARFLSEVPKVRVDLSLSDDPVPIVDAGFDLAIRMGSLDESDLVSRRLARIERKVIASPAYVSRRGTPSTIADLERHELLVSDPLRDTWRFDAKGGPRDIRVRWRLSTGGMMGLAEAARLGMGIAMLPSYMADPFIAARELVALDLGAAPTSADATALFPRSRTPSAAVRRLLDFIVAQLSGNPLFSPRTAAADKGKAIVPRARQRRSGPRSTPERRGA
jgi:DNA-binding transcriptional LysR family regulator